jgi:hypothetical protein
LLFLIRFGERLTRAALSIAESMAMW